MIHILIHSRLKKIFQKNYYFQINMLVTFIDISFLYYHIKIFAPFLIHSEIFHSHSFIYFHLIHIFVYVLYMLCSHVYTYILCICILGKCTYFLRRWFENETCHIHFEHSWHGTYLTFVYIHLSTNYITISYDNILSTYGWSHFH